MNTNRIGAFLLIGLFWVITSGCASFAGRELPVYANAQVADPGKRVSASYDVKVIGPHGENTRLATILDKEIRTVLAGTPLFSELKSGSDQKDYHYSFIVRNEGYPPEPVAFLNGFISGFTFTVIPAFARDIFIMSVEVKEGDHVVKTYTYRDHVDTWIQLLLVVLMPANWPPNVVDVLIDNMIMNFAHDFSIDVQSGVFLAKQN